MGLNSSCCQEEDPPKEVILPELVSARADPSEPSTAPREARPNLHQSWSTIAESNELNLSPPSKRSRLTRISHLAIDAEIVRGIDLRSTLHRRARLWRSSPLDLEPEQRANLWELSRPVDTFDTFLSHTWMTSGKWKILALILQSGWRWGLACWGVSVLLALLLCGLEVVPMNGAWTVSVAGWTAEDAPLGAWVISFGFLGTLLGFLLAVYVPKRCGGASETCFLDVVSIHQTDPELMERGIYGLGGFLTVSKELRVLWSPPYLSRLWCVFELAAYRTANPGGKIRLAPLCVEAVMLILWASGYLGTLFNQIATIGKLGDVLGSAGFFFGALPIMVAVHLLRHFSMDKNQLLRDLATFDVNKAECRSPFDREFIYAAIREWYGSPQAFSDYVRGPLRKELILKVHRSNDNLAYALLVTTGPLTSGLEFCISLWLAGAPADVILTQLVGIAVAQNMVWFIISVQVAIALCDCMPITQRGPVEFLKTLLICFVFGVSWALGRFVAQVAVQFGLGAAAIWFAIAISPLLIGACVGEKIVMYKAGIEEPPPEPKLAADEDNAPNAAERA